MTLQILLLLAGLALIVFGADWLVDGASAIARKAGISEFVIGLTIVGFGTSCPELVVSLTGAIQGNADISVGNVIGSNIFDTLLILGVTAVIAPVAVTRKNSRRDIPIALLVTFLFAAFAQTGRKISFYEGLAFLLVFAAYMVYCFKSDKGAEETAADGGKVRSVWLAVLLVLAGLGGLIFGGNLFVNNATAIARALGVSDKFIAIGASAVVTPISTFSLTWVDLGVLLSSAVVIWLWTYTGHRDRIDRWEAILMLLGFFGYYAWLFVKL